jgi:uncharacterized membrane protein (UPF0127 family)
MKRSVLIIFFAIIAIALILSVILIFTGKNRVVITSQEPPTPSLLINGFTVNLEIADTEQKKNEGLSNRDFLPQNSGMLFVFDTPGEYVFWMNEMNFPLDFIWLNGNKVVQTNENVPAPLKGEPPAVIKPEYAVDKVLEVNAGFIKSASVKIGDEVKINL